MKFNVQALFHFNDYGEGELISRDDVWSMQVAVIAYLTSNIQFLPELKYSSVLPLHVSVNK